MIAYSKVFRRIVQIYKKMIEFNLCESTHTEEVSSRENLVELVRWAQFRNNRGNSSNHRMSAGK